MNELECRYEQVFISIFENINTFSSIDGTLESAVLMESARIIHSFGRKEKRTFISLTELCFVSKLIQFWRSENDNVCIKKNCAMTKTTLLKYLPQITRFIKNLKKNGMRSRKRTTFLKNVKSQIIFNHTIDSISYNFNSMMIMMFTK